MDNKKIIEALVKIARNQQKIIHKLAQAQGVAADETGTATYQEGAAAPAASATPANALKPALQHKDPAAAIAQALGGFYNKALQGLSVDVNKHQVNVSFKPGQATQPNYDHVLATVQKLQNSNAIVGGPYSVKAA